MKQPKSCQYGGITRANNNCTKPGDDDLPVQCVGIWAADKHHYLRNYIEATRMVRRGYVSGEPGHDGGAGFVDLFAGPGRARIRETGEFIDGSPLIALSHDEAPFSSVVLCELDPENADTLRRRTARYGARVHVLEDDCNAAIGRAVELIPEYGLNIALVDPYGLGPLRFETLAALASVSRMDLMLHFPTVDIRRNFDHESTKRALDRFLGTTAWRKRVRRKADIAILIEVLREQLARFGYGSEETLRSVAIKNSTQGTLYHLVFASKHDRGGKIWNSITKNAPSGQRGFGF